MERRISLLIVCTYNTPDIYRYSEAAQIKKYTFDIILKHDLIKVKALISFFIRCSMSLISWLEFRIQRSEEVII